MAAAVDAPSHSVLALLGAVDPESSVRLVQSILEIPETTEFYASFTGTAGIVSPDSSAITAGAINALACLLDAVALSAQPRLRCVPLLPPAGWTLDRIAQLPVAAVLLPPPPSGAPGSSSANNPPAPEPLEHNHNHHNHNHHNHQQTQQLRPQGWGPLAGVQGPGFPGAGADDGGSGAESRPGSVEGLLVELERRRPPQLPRWVRRGLAARDPGGPDAAGCVAQGPEAERTQPSNAHNRQPEPLPQQQQQQEVGLPAVTPEPTNRVVVEASTPGSSNPTATPRAYDDPPATTATAAVAPPPAPDSSPPLEPAPYVTLVDGSPAPPDLPLRFGRVAVGGTFDRLHAGHELLLAATALVAEGFVFVGVTADALLANKSNRDLLQPYDKRAEEAVSYMRAVRPGLLVESGPLSDPRAPTLAELDPGMEALVVSVETLAGAAAINAGRVGRGFRPLTVVTVPVMGLRRETRGSARPQAAEAEAKACLASKLSSSGLRAMEAAAAAAARGHA